ncbi:VanZ family protein [Enterococcus sp. LJL99]
MYKKSGMLLFSIYLLILIWILLFKFSFSFQTIIETANNQSRRINLIPFSGSLIVNGQIDFKEIIDNLLIFVPFGGLLGIVDKKNSFLKKILFALLFSVAIEFSQYVFSLGATDITDVITNVSGAIIGLLIYKVLTIIFPEQKLDKVLVIVGSIILALSCLFIIFLIILN